MDGRSTIGSVNGSSSVSSVPPQPSRNLCRYFSSRGECFYGDSCAYVHQSPGSRSGSFSDSSPIPNSQSTNGHRVIMNPGVRNTSTYGQQMHNNSPSNNSGGHGGNSTSLNSPIGGHHSSHRSNSHGGDHGHSSSFNVPSNSSRPGMGHGHHGHGSSMSNSGNTSSSYHSQQQQQVINHVTMPQLPPCVFISEDVRFERLRKQMLMMSVSNSEAIYPNLPLSIGGGCYVDLFPLEDNISGEKSITFQNVITSVYRATEIKTGEIITLRRIHNFQIPRNIRSVVPVIESWKKIIHPGIVSLRHVFPSDDFNDSSLIFVYDHYPGCATLQSQYFINNANSHHHHLSSSSNHHHATSSSSTATNGGIDVSHVVAINRPYSQQPTTKLIPESLIWSYVIQLSSALRYVHSMNLAIRSFDPTKILLVNGLLPDPKFISNQQLQQQVIQQPRLRINCVGMFDVLLHESHLRDLQATSREILIQQYQSDDLIALGRVILALACNSRLIMREHWAASLDFVGKTYSHDLRALIAHLLNIKPSSNRSINDIMPMIGGRFYSQIDLTHQKFDILDSELGKELDSGRLFRLLVKLNCIVERPGHGMDLQWSETGDRYLLKLFRDYLFHQTNPEDGRPFLDFGHVITCLNKLELGSVEKICLISRDEQNVLIVSFEELKKCFESSFNELLM